ncbi:hypothetical protein BD779DRAFT_505854 [Infundibulicybe gibba]|nr:hypothetical protein BD779DRAFT_505854 [Infundibulicybe gibba]
MTYVSCLVMGVLTFSTVTYRAKEDSQPITRMIKLVFGTPHNPRKRLSRRGELMGKWGVRGVSMGSPGYETERVSAMMDTYQATDPSHRERAKNTQSARDWIKYGAR